MEGDADTDGLVILGENLAPKQPRHKCGDALLAVDEDAFAGRRSAVLEFHGGIAPCDEVANGVSLIERVEEVADLGRLPNERTLNFRDGDLARLHPGKQSFNGMRSDGVALGRHGSGFPSVISPSRLWTSARLKVFQRSLSLK